jgi:hypothetical protein
MTVCCSGFDGDADELLREGTGPIGVVKEEENVLVATVLTQQKGRNHQVKQRR